MRWTIALALALSAQAAHADDANFCERTWPSQPRPSAADSRHCGMYWLENYGGDSDKDQDILWDLPANDLERLGDQVRDACGAPCIEASQMFDDLALSHFDLLDRASHRSIAPILGKLLRGERLETVEAMHWSSVTLARLVAAPNARWGKRFASPDLQRFFYGDRGPDAGKSDLLPRRQDPGYSDGKLTANDRANVALLERADSGALAMDRGLEPRFCRRFCSERDTGGPPPCGQCTKEMFEDGEARVTLCEKQWPAPAPPDRGRDSECADYYERRYTDVAGKPKLATDIVANLSSRQLLNMAKRLRDGGLATDYPRAVRFLEAAAACHFDLIDPRTNSSFEPALKTILSGSRVPPEMMKAFAPVTVWRLRAAPAARRGKIFDDEDLQKFYYGKGATRSKMLPLIANAHYSEADLDEVDRANIAAANN